MEVIMEKFDKDVVKVLVSQEEIALKVKELGEK